MVTAEAIRGQVEWLEQRASFRDEPEVLRYLENHPDLVPILLEALDALATHFGPDAPVVLEVLTDPEEEEEIKTSTAIVQTTLAPDRVIALERRFDDAWWREASFRTGDRLSFGVEYV